MYKELAFLYHPDITKKDTNKEMSVINDEYKYLFDIVKNIKFNYKEQKFYENKEETKEKYQDFQKIIDKLIKVKNINIMICGRFCYPHNIKTINLRTLIHKVFFIIQNQFNLFINQINNGIIKL